MLKGQAQRSGGALYYRNYDEFAAALKILLERPDVARSLGAAGRDYVARTYRWPTVMGTLDTFLAGLSTPFGGR